MKTPSMLALVFLGCAEPEGAPVAPPKTAGTATAPAADASPAVASLASLDIALVGQDGRTVRLAELAEGKAVVVNAFFTSCTEICPMMAASLSAVAEGLGPRLGRDVVMVSLSLDPTTDTPERLRAFAARYGGRPGWHFLTGDRVALARLVDELGLGAAAKEAHTPVLLVGAPGLTPWSRVSGISGPDVVVSQILAIADAR